jgi:hypothetical protein
MERTDWTNRLKNEVVLHRVIKERNIRHTINRRKVKGLGNILHRNCLLKHVIEEKIGRTEDEKEDVNSYGITLRKRKKLNFKEGTLNPTL